MAAAVTASATVTLNGGSKGAVAPVAGDQNADISVTPYASAETFSWGTDVGYSLINSIELQIGGTKINLHYGKWMHISGSINKSNQDVSHAQIIGPTTAAGAAPSHELFVPLQFFCCRNDGLAALPLIALQYHDVRLEFNFETGARKIRC